MGESRIATCCRLMVSETENIKLLQQINTCRQQCCAQATEYPEQLASLGIVLPWLVRPWDRNISISSTSGKVAPYSTELGRYTIPTESPRLVSTRRALRADHDYPRYCRRALVSSVARTLPIRLATGVRGSRTRLLSLSCPGIKRTWRSWTLLFLW